jgi:hypothetical protein
MLAAKRKRLLSFIDAVMKDADQLSDEELVELSRELKEGWSDDTAYPAS